MSPAQRQAVDAALAACRKHGGKVRREASEAGSGASADRLWEALTFDPRVVLPKSAVAEMVPHERVAEFLRLQVRASGGAVEALAAHATLLAERGLAQPLTSVFAHPAKPVSLSGVAAAAGASHEGATVFLTGNTQPLDAGDLLVLVHPLVIENCWLILRVGADRRSARILARSGRGLSPSWFACRVAPEAVDAVCAAIAGERKNLLADPEFAEVPEEGRLVTCEQPEGGVPGCSVALGRNWAIGVQWQEGGRAEFVVRRRRMDDLEGRYGLDLDVRRMEGVRSWHLVQVTDAQARLCGFDAVASAYVRRFAGTRGHFAMHMLHIAGGKPVAPSPETWHDGFGSGFSRLEVFRGIAATPDNANGALRFYLTLPVGPAAQIRVVAPQMELGQAASSLDRTLPPPPPDAS